MSNKEQINFEDKIKNAKELLEKLINPEITMSDSVDIYKNGMNELSKAQQLLEEAKLEFEEISK